MPTSDVIRHRKSSDVNLFLVPENIVWDEGATKMKLGRGTIGVAKHERAVGKCGGRLSSARVLGSIRQ